MLTRLVQAVMLTTLILATTTSCEYVKNKVKSEEEKPAHTDSVTIIAYSNEVQIGEKPNFMEGVSATHKGGNLKVKVDTSKVNLNQDGDYPVIYSAVGSDGYVNTKEVRLKVTDPNKKVIYLTFDDGPSENTPRILAILRQYGVHATFFVVGHHEKTLHYIADEMKDGNAIAAHTFTHDFNIYKSMDTYFDDLEKIQAVIKKYTGHRTNIIRFPGGSSNTVSKKRSGDPDYMYKLTQEVLKRGYQYVDWNASTKDASVNHPSKELCIRSACRANGTQLCMLMHDTMAKEGTVQALPTIIEFFKAHGYEFRTITSTGYICHHGIHGEKPKYISKKIKE